MSRRGKGSKALQLSTLRGCVTKMIRATRAHEMMGAGYPEDIPYIEAEYREAGDVLDNQLKRVMAERAELVAAVNEALELYMGMLHSDYPNSHIVAAEQGEVGRLRTVVSKYVVKS
jgi:hypothetical protein